QYGALYLGESVQFGDPLSDVGAVIYGLRLEGRSYGVTAPNQATWSYGGRPPGDIPGSLGLSPRVGWRYRTRTGRWVLWGGVGEFRGSPPLQALSRAAGELGEATMRELVCLGPAAPQPDWDLYASQPDAAP